MPLIEAPSGVDVTATGRAGRGRAVRAALLVALAALAGGAVGAATARAVPRVRRHLNRCVAPAIVVQPAGEMIVANGSATLAVQADGAGLVYEWHRGSSGDVSSPIPGAASPTLVTGPLAATASFWVRVSNGCGHADSVTAVVTVLGPRTVYLGPGNTVPLDLAPIPAGTFAMGSPDSERGRSANEGPQHAVTISRPFYLGRTEVTQAQWQAVMGSDPAHFTWCGGTCPVEHVTWSDVAGPGGFLDTLSRLQGAAFRLPSEAEWEYAARAGTTTRFSWGDVLACDDGDCTPGACPTHDQHMWWCGNQGDTTFQVAQKLANPWGLFDLSGNVGEWVQDWWHDSYAGAPADGSAWLVPVGVTRVVRGGGWGGDATWCRSAKRYAVPPDSASDSIGFRVVVSP
jgi:formylglycine-generating enzyme required for sulfatase activity